MSVAIMFIVAFACGMVTGGIVYQSYIERNNKECCRNCHHARCTGWGGIHLHGEPVFHCMLCNDMYTEHKGSDTCGHFLVAERLTNSESEDKINDILKRN